MKRLLIIGAGEAGEMVAKEILDNPLISGKYRLEGFLDDDQSKKKLLGHPVLGRIGDAPSVIEERGIAEVIIAIPSGSKEIINRVVNSLAGAQVNIKIVPGMYEIIEGRASFSQVRSIEPADLLGREEVGFDLESISDYYRDRSVFVTGAGGSIGSEIFTQILALPVREAVAFGHGENSIHGLITRLGPDPRFRYVIGDVRDPAKVHREMERFRPDIVFHAAAHKHLPLMEDYPDEAVKNNILGTFACALAAMESGVGRFIFVSTDKAVNPTSVMGATKRVAERIVLSLKAAQSKTSFSLTRFGNVLGSRGSVVPIFRAQIERGGPVTVTHPEMTRFFMSIREAARLVVKSASIPEGTVFVLEMGKPVRIADLAREMIRLHGFTEEEIPIIYIGLRPGEKMYEEVLSDREDLNKTRYDKLLVSTREERPLGSRDLSEMVSEVADAAERCDGERIRALLKKYVPEYTGA